METNGFFTSDELSYTLTTRPKNAPDGTAGTKTRVTITGLMSATEDTIREYIERGSRVPVQSRIRPESVDDTPAPETYEVDVNTLLGRGAVRIEYVPLTPEQQIAAQKVVIKRRNPNISEVECHNLAIKEITEAFTKRKKQEK